MENIFIITIGTNDIKLNIGIKNNEVLMSKIKIRDDKKEPTCTLPASCRADGEVIFNNFEQFKDFVIYPIIKPAIDRVLNEASKLDRIYLIATDQSSENVDEFFKNFDTIYYAQIIMKKIKDDYKDKVRKMEVRFIGKDVNYYDSMYDYFSINVIPDIVQKYTPTNSQMYILPQGGIDAINHTLLLKILEYYPNAKQLSKPENSKIAGFLNFPQKFTKNIQKHKIIHAAENFNYASILAYNYSDFINYISLYANALLSFNLDEARKYVYWLSDNFSGHRNEIAPLVNDFLNMENSYEEKIREFYLSAKIKYKQKFYSEFLMKIFVVAETLLKPLLEKLLGGEIKFNEATNHKEWNDLIAKRTDLIEYLKTCTVDGKPLFFNKPNRKCYVEIFEFLTKDTTEFAEMIRLIRVLEHFTIIRNSIAHGLNGVSENIINEELKKRNANITVTEFIEIADAYFKIEEFGHYQKINELILNNLNKS